MIGFLAGMFLGSSVSSSTTRYTGQGNTLSFKLTIENYEIVRAHPDFRDLYAFNTYNINEFVYCSLEIMDTDGSIGESYIRNIGFFDQVIKNLCEEEELEAEK